MTPTRHVMVTVDFSKFDSFAVEVATRLTHALQARLTIAHVVEPMPSYCGQMFWGMTISSREDRQRRLDLVVPMGKEIPFAHKMLHADSESLTVDGDIVCEIVSFARTHDVDLIVIGSHGRSGIIKLLTGRVTEGVLRHAPCDVLVARDRLPS